MPKKKPVRKKGLLARFKAIRPNQRNQILAVVVVFAVSMVGYFGFVRSSADSFTEAYKIQVSSELGCKLAGRVWKPNKTKCDDVCRHAGVSLKYTANPVRGYCDGYVTLQMAASECVNNLHRYFIKDVGCSKRANNENTNDSPQCIPGYPNYKAELQTDKCVVNEIPGAPTGGGAGQVGSPKDNLYGGNIQTPVTVPPNAGTNGSGGGSSGGSTSPGEVVTAAPVTAPTTETADKCRVLGRKWDNKNNRCTQTCQPDAGSLKTGAKTGLKYCGKALADGANMTEDICANKRHRVWLVEGCARRADQADSKNAIQCQAGFSYYNANVVIRHDRVADDETTVDYCEISELVAKANEMAGTPGDTDTPSETIAQNDDSVTVNPDDTVVVTPVSVTGSGEVKGIQQSVQVDAWLTEAECHLRGRSWIPADKKLKFKGGCSRQECFIKSVKVRSNKGAEYCEGYVNRNMQEKKCGELHRKWLKDIEGCATRPNQKRTKPLVNAEQCQAKYPVYIFHTTDQGNDECITKSALQYFQGVAGSTGRSIAKLTSMPMRQVCKIQKLVLRDGTCKKKVVPATSAGESESYVCEDGKHVLNAADCEGAPEFKTCPPNNKQIPADQTCPVVEAKQRDSFGVTYLLSQVDEQPSDACSTISLRHPEVKCSLTGLGATAAERYTCANLTMYVSFNIGSIGQVLYHGYGCTPS